MKKEVFRKQLKTELEKYYESVHWVLDNDEYKLIIDTEEKNCCAMESVLCKVYEASGLSLEEFAVVIVSSLEERLDISVGDMEYEQFREQLISEIKKVKGIHQVKESLFTISLNVIDGMADLEIDLKEAYQDYKNGISFNIIRKHILDIVNAEIKNALSKLMRDAVEQVMEDRATVLNRVVYVPEREECIDKEILSEIPNLRLYDMRFLPCIDVSCNIDGVQTKGTVYLSKDIMKKLGISSEQLYDSAIKNIKNIPVIYHKTAAEEERLNIAHTDRCLCILGKNANLSSNLLYKPFFDKIGAAFQEPFYLVLNNDQVMSAYPSSETSIGKLKSEFEKYRAEYQNISACGDIIFYYENGIVEVK